MSASFEKAAKKEVSYADLLDELLATEVSSMAQKHHQMRIAMARFPLQKTLEGFDFKSQTSIDSKLVRELATGRYMRSGDTCYSSGRPEWGKAICDLVAPGPVGQRSHLPAEPRPKRTKPTRRDRAAPGTTCSSSTMLSMATQSAPESVPRAPFPCHRLLLSFARASPCLPTSRYYHRSCIISTLWTATIPSALEHPSPSGHELVSPEQKFRH